MFLALAVGPLRTATERTGWTLIVSRLLRVHYFFTSSAPSKSLVRNQTAMLDA